jgi:hypothetical protein
LKKVLRSGHEKASLLEIENVSGKSTLSVQQDFYAKIVAMNLTVIMAQGTRQITARETKYLEHGCPIKCASTIKDAAPRCPFGFTRAQWHQADY